MEVKSCKVPYRRTLERGGAKMPEYRDGQLTTGVLGSVMDRRKVSWETDGAEEISFHAAEG